MNSDLLTFEKAGIYCERADVYIDPGRKVDRAVITHGHADHARRGHKAYLCSDLCKPVLQHRLGKNLPVESVPYGQTVKINGVAFSFHPAGHIIGSSQVRVAYKGDVWVATGDYKMEDDGFTTPYEPVRCNTFITETTFGLPIYKWRKQSEVFDEIHQWWAHNQRSGVITVLQGYSLGKAQRLLHNLDPSQGRIFADDAIQKMNMAIREAGKKLHATELIHSRVPKQDLQGALILATSTGANSRWMRQDCAYSVGFASGWMALRSRRLRGGMDRGFVLSDHCDWDELNEAVHLTGAEKVFAIHGYTSAFSRWLTENGIDAHG